MRKKLAMILVVSMAVAIVGCGRAKQDNTSNQEVTPTPESNVENTDGTNNTADTDNIEDIAGNAGTQEGTTGAVLLQDFQTRAADAEAEAIANGILKNQIIAFKGMVSEVQPGFLNGFDGEIKGFESGVMFAPMVGSIPFVGYIFTLSDESEVDAFVNTLKNVANPRWNVCTEADETVVDHVGNKVFFLMCPANLEE